MPSHKEPQLRSAAELLVLGSTNDRAKAIADSFGTLNILTLQRR
jgi:hypothetical protein